MGIVIHNGNDFDGMRKAGRVSAQILDELYSFVKVGISTEDINTFVHERTIQLGGIPAPLNYKGFPKSVCTSINDVVCHGIPKSTDILKDGDILNIDVTTIIDGYYGDTSRMYVVGDGFKDNNKYQEKKKLIEVTYKSMMKGINAAAKQGAYLTDIGRVIQEYAEKNNFSVIKDFCGHGIGKKFHMEPTILHYVPEKKYQKHYNMKIEPGMIFTIEPMINIGSWECYVDDEDGWTARTIDGGLSAQFEHTIGITDKGVEIFTISPNNIDPLKVLYE